MSLVVFGLEDAVTILQFLLDVTRMKAIPRSGWISHGVSLQDVESVADHTFSTCVLSSVLADLEGKRGVRVNVEQVLRIAVLHDMSESLTFDISKAYLEYLGKRGEKMKDEIERSAWRHLVKRMRDPRLTREYAHLYAEYAANKTVEAKIVHAADALDILLQVIDYRRKGYPESMLADLWNSTSAQLGKTKLPSVRKILRMIRREAKRVRN